MVQLVISHRALILTICCFHWLIALQNQFFISGLAEDDTIQNRVLEALYRRILLAHKEQKCFRVIVVLPLLPGFQVQLFALDPDFLFFKSKLLSLLFLGDQLLPGRCK